jgi:adenosylcobinamide-GDP ribazoletransferase
VREPETGLPEDSFTEDPRGRRLQGFRSLLVACRYLTALPLPPASEAGDLGRAAGWFPVVGLILGALLAAVMAAAGVLLPPLVAAVLVVALWAALTGGLHLDGLADTLDGLGGGVDREEALAIMRDPRTGAYGVAGIVLVLGLKIAALASLPSDLSWRALVTAPVLARVGPLALARCCPPARGEGAGHAFVLSVGAPSLGAAVLVGAGVALGLVGPWGVLLVVGALIDALGFAWYLRLRLGGATGDCLGALVEASEASTLTLLAALAYLQLR